MQRRPLVEFLAEGFRVSERRACRALRFPRSSHRYRGKTSAQAALRMRIRELAAVRVRWGYKRIHVLLRREGWRVNHKRVWRLYRQEGLNLRAKRPRRHPRTQVRGEKPEAGALNGMLEHGLHVGRPLRRAAVQGPDGGR